MPTAAAKDEVSSGGEEGLGQRERRDRQAIRSGQGLPRPAQPLDQRWIVERTFAWLGRCRRLAKDWERLNRKALAFLRLASA